MCGSGVPQHFNAGGAAFNPGGELDPRAAAWPKGKKEKRINM